MIDVPGLCVALGGAPYARGPGVLQAGWHGEADVPYQPGDEFPFEDSAVDALVVADCMGFISPETTLHLLLECRRVLRPGGLVRLAAHDSALNLAPVAGDDPSSDANARLAEMALLVGLEPSERTACIPRAEQAIAAMCGAGRRTPDRAFSKRDRRIVGDPLVSILIPAYNRGFFAECLDSALAQTYANIEIVIADDSAGPEIESTVRARADSRVRYERNVKRLRPRGNFVRCFERAEGEFVKFLCDDDLLAPACVERLLDGFRRAPDVTLATSHRLRIDEQGRRLPDQPATAPIVAQSSVIAGYTLANAMLIAGLNTIGEPSTTLFRKSDFADAARGYFHFNGAAGRGVIDMVMWTALLLKGNAVYLRESLSSFRNHPSQRQRDPATQRQSIDSIRGLQTAWLALKLHERQAPDELLARPFPAGDTDWKAQPVLGFAARRVGATHPKRPMNRGR